MVQDLKGRYRSLSYWFDSLSGDDLPEPWPSLDRDVDADVAIVGVGYTGLWTAYYLLRAEPSLRITLVEREIAGFGAPGRNGGWCSALFPASWEKIARASIRSEAVRLQREMFATVDEVGRVADAENICGLDQGRDDRGGPLGIARYWWGIGGAGPQRRNRLGGRLCRRRRGGVQPDRANAGRPRGRLTGRPSVIARTFSRLISG